MQKRVFISYRRSDTAAAAGRVYDRLWRILDKPNVFFDVIGIGGGEDFEERITAEIARSDAILVFIGARWLDLGESDRSRIFDPADYVRAEIRAALTGPGLVLPVLVDGAQMPSAESLPSDIRDLCKRNAVRIRHETFDDDTENIVRLVLGDSIKSRVWDKKRSLIRPIVYTFIGMSAAMLALTVVAIIHFWLSSQALSASIGETPTTILLVLGTLMGGGVGFTIGIKSDRSGNGVRSAPPSGGSR